jgi:hypothetical protein
MGRGGQGKLSEVKTVDRSEARRLAQALRKELWVSASDELLERLADRGGMKVGLNPPEQIEDEELAEVVWRALRLIDCAEGE